MGIKEKIDEQIELEAKISGGKRKAGELDTKLNDIEKEINNQREVKAELIKKQESAYQELEDAGDSVSLIQSKIDSMKKELTSAKATQKKCQEAVDSYTEEVMSEPDKTIIVLNGEKDKTHKERETLSKSIAGDQEKLHILKEELKKDGYELNISGNPAATTTYF